MNPLYQQLIQNSPTNNVTNLLQRFTQFRNSFNGNAQQKIQEMLQSGQITQSQYNQAVAQAQQLTQLFRN